MKEQANGRITRRYSRLHTEKGNNRINQQYYDQHKNVLPWWIRENKFERASGCEGQIWWALGLHGSSRCLTGQAWVLLVVSGPSVPESGDTGRLTLQKKGGWIRKRRWALQLSAHSEVSGCKRDPGDNNLWIWGKTCRKVRSAWHACSERW